MEYQHFIRKLAGTSPIILNAAGVVITNSDNQLLLFKRAVSGLWAIPGGHMDIGESLEETAVRETFEETGLTLHTLELLTVVSGKNTLVKHRDGSQTYYVTAIFGSKSFSGELRGSDEGQEVAFFDLEGLPAPLSAAAVGAAEYLRNDKS